MAASIADLLAKRESNQREKLNTTVTVTVTEVFRNLSDIIPEDDYRPFYVSRYQKLGYKRFMELANKARTGKTPDRLFFWMLKNNGVVR